MRKVYSFSLEEKLAVLFDEYCIKTGRTRSEIISGLIEQQVSCCGQAGACLEDNHSKAAGKAALEVICGAKPGKVYQIKVKGSTLVGRKADGVSPDIDLGEQLKQGEAAVSRQHAELSWQQGRLVIKDLGGVNGTYVNGRRITGTCQLDNGDRVKFANVDAKVLLG